MRANLLGSPTDPVPVEGGSAQASLIACTPEDARGLATTFAAMLPWSRYPFSAAALENYLGQQEPCAPRFSLHISEKPVGALGLRLNWLRGPYIQFFGLMPQYQRSGLGTAMLTRVIADARTNGDRNVWVAASAFNADALRFYERHGFTRAALLDGLVQDGIDEVLLRKRL